MLIDLESDPLGVARVWVTAGADDFVRAARRWATRHAPCGAPASLAHLSLAETSDDADGLRRVAFYCQCGGTCLVLGPPDGGDLPPSFPRLQ